MAPTATYINDGTQNPSMRAALVATRDGTTAERHYLINTGDVAEALSADGLPRVGDAFSVAFPTLVVTSIQIHYREGELCEAAVNYTTPQPGRFQPVPLGPDDAYTEVQLESSSVRALFDVEGTVEPIANGEGAQVQTNEIRFIVHAFYTHATMPDLGRLIDLSTPNHLNDADVLLPPFASRDGPRWLLLRGQARYAGFVPTLIGNGLVEVTHHIVGASTHDYLWSPVDAQGMATGSPIASRIYNEGSFAGLWP